MIEDILDPAFLARRPTDRAALLEWLPNAYRLAAIGLVLNPPDAHGGWQRYALETRVKEFGEWATDELSLATGRGELAKVAQLLSGTWNVFINSPTSRPAQRLRGPNNALQYIASNAGSIQPNLELAMNAIEDGTQAEVAREDPEHYTRGSLYLLALSPTDQVAHQTSLVYGGMASIFKLLRDTEGRTWKEWQAAVRYYLPGAESIWGTINPSKVLQLDVQPNPLGQPSPQNEAAFRPILRMLSAIAQLSQDGLGLPSLYDHITGQTPLTPTPLTEMWALAGFARSPSYTLDKLRLKGKALMQTVPNTKPSRQAVTWANWTAAAAETVAAMLTIEDLAGMPVPMGAAEYFTTLAVYFTDLATQITKIEERFSQARIAQAKIATSPNATTQNNPKQNDKDVGL